MSIYIVRSKSLSGSLVSASFSGNLGSINRQSQINEVLALRMSDPGDQEIRRWMSDPQNHKGNMISHGESSTPVTGTVLLDMTQEQAAQLTKDVPDALILRDQPIELIRPRRNQLLTSINQVSTSDLWHLQAIGLQAARSDGFQGTGAGVTVAVLDTGIDASHTELAGKVSDMVAFDVQNWQAVPQAVSTDTSGHGTHVAGLICGNQVGVAPGAKVVNGMMIPNGRGNVSDFILALEWAAQRPEVQIVNMSAGILGYLPEMREAVTGLMAVGVLFVCATGNEGPDRTRSPGNYIEALSVGASNREGKIAAFSSSGTLIANNHQYGVPDLVAPGEAVFSSAVGGNYEAWDGTSMATPVVSGVAALILEKFPTISQADLQEAILSSCHVLSAPSGRQGRGLVQVGAVL